MVIICPWNFPLSFADLCRQSFAKDWSSIYISESSGIHPEFLPSQRCLRVLLRPTVSRWKERRKQRLQGNHNHDL